MNLRKTVPFTLFILLSLLLGSCATSRPSPSAKGNLIYVEKPSKVTRKKVKKIIKYARRFIGKKYKYGGKGPRYFDCSGYTRYIFKHFGYLLPHSSRMQSTKGKRVALKRARPGDLVFFSGRRTGNKVGHVGIIIACGPSGFQFIHAPYKGVKIDEYPYNSYYRKHFLMVRRILK